MGQSTKCGAWKTNKGGAVMKKRCWMMVYVCVIFSCICLACDDDSDTGGLVSAPPIDAVWTIDSTVEQDESHSDAVNNPANKIAEYCAPLLVKTWDCMVGQVGVDSLCQLYSTEWSISFTFVKVNEDETWTLSGNWDAEGCTFVCDPLNSVIDMSSCGWDKGWVLYLDPNYMGIEYGNQDDSNWCQADCY